MKRILFTMAMLLMVVAVMFAQEKTYTMKESELTADQKAKVQTRETQTAVSSWVGAGKEVGTAIKEGLSALNTEVNKFSESPAGHFTMFIIAYKVIGNDMIQFIIGFPLFLFGSIAFVYSYRKHCLPHRVLVSKTGPFYKREKKYEVVNENIDWNNAPAPLFYAVCYTIFLIITSIITFS